MSFVEPVTLRRGGLLEPLALSHEEGLRRPPPTASCGAYA